MRDARSIHLPAPGTGVHGKLPRMSKSPNRKTLENQLDRHGATLHRRTTGSFAQCEDGSVAPWHVQNGTTRIPFSNLADVAAYIDRRNGDV
jgi:hypothetical protein